MTNVVDVYINYLRKKLSAKAGSTGLALIETVRGSGYRIRPAAYHNRAAKSGKMTLWTAAAA